MVALASAPLAVLTLEQKVLDDGTAAEKQHQVAQHDSVPGVKLRRVPIAVDVGRNNSVQVAPADDESQRHSSFINSWTTQSANRTLILATQGQQTFSIVARPRDGVGDGWVNAHRSQEGPRILCTGGITPQKHGESNNSQDRDCDVTDASLPRAIGQESDADG